jgi:hypothetical protein
MLSERTTEPTAIRAQVRETERSARRLIVRAAYLEKLARRPRAGAAERLSLETRALELRADAATLLAQISELSRQVA